MSDLEQIIKLVRDLAGVDEKKLLSFQAHGFRVMYLACKLGRRMGVYDADLRLAALLHDIGKIGVDKGSRRRRSGNTSRTRRRRATNPDFRCAN
ncbi:MAG: HD domain-containing protein [Clostridia bacterium]